MTRFSGQIFRSSSVVSVFTLLSRVLGLIRDSLVALFFGAGFASDAFFVAYKIPNLLRRLVAEGSLPAAFIPVLADQLGKPKNELQDSIRSITTFVLLGSLALSLGCFIFSDELTFLFSPGFGWNSEKSELAASLLRIMLPYIIAASLLALCSSILNSLGYFALPALAPAILNVAIISAVLCWNKTFTEPITILAYATVGGGFLALVPLLLQLRRLGFTFRFRLSRSDKLLGRFLHLLLPALLSASVYQLIVFLNTLLASLLSEGAISRLYYADRLFQFPLGIFSYAITSAIFPVLSQAYANHEQDEFNRKLLLALNWISFITIPAAFGLIILAEPIVELLFERGSFTAQDTALTAQSLVAFSIGLWAASAQGILVRAYLAKQSSWIPSLVTICSLFVNFVLALSLMGRLNQGTETILGQALFSAQEFLQLYSLGEVGLALAGSIASFVTFFLLFVFLPKISVQGLSSSLLWNLAKALASSIVMAVVIELSVGSMPSPLFRVVLGIPLGILIYLLSSYWLKVEETRSSWRSLLALLETIRGSRAEP